jgi:hypothetical protein
MPLLLTSFARSIPLGLPSRRAEATVDPAILNKGASRSEGPPCQECCCLRHTSVGTGAETDPAQADTLGGLHVSSLTHASKCDQARLRNGVGHDWPPTEPTGRGSRA